MYDSEESGMQRKWVTGLALAAFLLLAVSAPLAAQSGITMEGGPGQSVTFTGQGSGTNTIGVALGTCTGGACSLTGTESGTGSLSSTGSFDITSTANSISLTPSSTTAGLFTVNATSPINFTLTGTAGSQSGTLLSGSLDLVNFYQQPGPTVGSGSMIGSFNENMAANMTITGGILASAFSSNGGVMQLNVQFTSPVSISTLEGTSLSEVATLISSSITPTPEPSSLLLFGAGLLMLGGVLRRRLRYQGGMKAAS